MVLGFGNNFNMFGSMGGFMNSNPLSFFGMGCGIGSNPFMSILGGGTCCNSIFGNGMFTDKCGRPNYDAMAGFGVGSFLLNIGTSLACQAIQGHGGGSSSKTISSDISDMEKKKEEIIKNSGLNTEEEINNFNIEKTSEYTDYTKAKSVYDENQKLIDAYTDEDKKRIAELDKKHEEWEKNTDENKGQDPKLSDEYKALDKKKTDCTEAMSKKSGLKSELDRTEKAKNDLEKKIANAKEKLETINSQIEEAQRQLADKATTKVKIDEDKYNDLFKNNNKLDINDGSKKENVKTAKMALNKALVTYTGTTDAKTKSNAKEQIRQLYEYLLHNDPDAITSKQEEACKQILK